MIKKSASGNDAELPFAIYDNDNLPINGFVFTTGQVKVRLPGAVSFVNADILNIVSVGKGQYVLKLTSVQTNVAGLITIKFSDGVNRTWVNYEVIGSDSVSLTEVLFNVNNGLTGVPGVVFGVGDIEVRVPGGVAFANADMSQVTDLGEGLYSYALTPAQKLVAGAYFVHYEGVYDPYYVYEHNIGNVSEVTPTPPTPIPAPAATPDIPLTAHGAAMLLRLCEYSKQEVLD